jgi:predicted nucleic acid-binding protein
VSPSIIVDASVAMKWLVPEEGSDKAEDLAASYDTICAPTLIIAEVGNGLWKKHRNQLIDTKAAQTIFKELPRFFRELVPPDSLVQRALELSLAADHPIYDCVYLALAERRRDPLVTADERMAARFAGTAIGSVVVTLSQWQPAK